jgi:hypothetical protein
MEQVKLPEELLLEIQKVRDELAGNVVSIGRLNVQLSFLKKDVSSIEDELSRLYNKAEEISAKEAQIQDKVVSQYGVGKLNFETGMFTKD